jgi:hypothetical protein
MTDKGPEETVFLTNFVDQKPSTMGYALHIRSVLAPGGGWNCEAALERLVEGSAAAETTEGRVRFHEWMDGSWAVLLSHPKGFRSVCTTELGYMAKLKPEFDRRNVKIIGLSVDPIDRHRRLFPSSQGEWALRASSPQYWRRSNFVASSQLHGSLLCGTDEKVEASDNCE